MPPQRESLAAASAGAGRRAQPGYLQLPTRRRDIVFAALIVLALGAIPWRMSIFTWWPIWRVEIPLEIPGGPAINVGVLTLLPLVLFVAWVMMRLRERARWRSGPLIVTGPLLGVSFLALLGLRNASGLSLVQAGGLGIMWLVYLFLINERPRLTFVLAGIVLLQGSVALGQLVRQAGLGLASLGELPLSLTVDSISVLQGRGHVWIRAYGLTPSPNVLGACMAVLLLILLQPATTHTRRTAMPSRCEQIVLAAAITMGELGLLASFSRAAGLAFAAGVLVAVWQRWRAGARPQSRADALLTGRLPSAGVAVWWVGPVLATLIFAVVYGNLALGRVINLDTPTEERSLSERERDVALAWQIIRAHPWWGVGTGNYGTAARALNADALVVHNVPLMVTAEWGIPGLILWSFLALAGLRQRSNARAAWLALLVVGLFDLSLWPTTSWHGAILLGLLAAQIGDDSGNGQNAHRI